MISFMISVVAPKFQPGGNFGEEAAAKVAPVDSKLLLRIEGVIDDGFIKSLGRAQ